MLYGILPEAFWPLALAHAFALLCPGPDFMLIVSHGMRHRLRGSAFICAGIAAGNAAYIALAIAGWMGLSSDSSFQRPLEIAGALYLAWLGWRIFRSAKPLAEEPETAEASSTAGTAARALPAPKQFAMGFGSAILNPKNMVFYLSIMTVLIESDALMRQRVAAGVWMCGLVLLWDLFVAALISRPKVQRTLWRWIPLIEKVCGLFLIVVAVSVLFFPA